MNFIEDDELAMAVKPPTGKPAEKAKKKKPRKGNRRDDSHGYGPKRNSTGLCDSQSSASASVISKKSFKTSNNHRSSKDQSRNSQLENEG